MSKLCRRGEDVTLALMQDSASPFEPLQSHNDVSSMCDINNVTRPIALLAYCNVCLCVHCDIFHHGMVVYQTTFDANKQQKKQRNMDIHRVRDTRA